MEEGIRGIELTKRNQSRKLGGIDLCLLRRYETMEEGLDYME